MLNSFQATTTCTVRSMADKQYIVTVTMHSGKKVVFDQVIEYKFDQDESGEIKPGWSIKQHPNAPSKSVYLDVERIESIVVEEM